jgi:hypothetical protein
LHRETPEDEFLLREKLGGEADADETRRRRCERAEVGESGSDSGIEIYELRNLLFFI